jgi:salicylate hydroxylase
MGPGGHFVHYFVSGGRYLNFVAVREQSDWVRESWTDHADISEVHASYQGWHPQIHAILDAVDEAFKWALFDREPLATWSKGRVTLLGDACHPMLPYMAQGAAQAIEDGATLAACIRGASAKTIESAINLYETLRKPRTAQIQALARRNSSVFHLPDGPEQRERDARMAARRDQSKVSKGPSVRTMIFGVSADAKVAHCAEVNLTHLGNNGGFARAVDVEPGASSGDTSFGPSWVWCARDSAAVRLFAEYGEAVPSGPKGRSLRPACPAVDQTGGVQGLSA